MAQSLFANPYLEHGTLYRKPDIKEEKGGEKSVVE